MRTNLYRRALTAFCRGLVGISRVGYAFFPSFFARELFTCCGDLEGLPSNDVNFDLKGTIKLSVCAYQCEIAYLFTWFDGIWVRIGGKNHKFDGQKANFSPTYSRFRDGTCTTQTDQSTGTGESRVCASYALLFFFEARAHFCENPLIASVTACQLWLPMANRMKSHGKL